MPKGGAAAVVIGDEVLSGKVRDENGPYLIAALRGAGISLGRVVTVGDDVEEIAWAVRTCREHFAPIFTSGGIGPTHDDVTVAGVAAALGRPVVRHPEIEAAVREHWGASITEEALRLARVPEGATLLRASSSWYPVITIEGIYLLPGVPELFRRHVDALAVTFRQAPFHLRCVFVSLGETEIAAALDRIAAAFPAVALGSYPRFDPADHRVKLTLESKDPAVVEASLSALLAALPHGCVVRVE